jgi:murein DD-endopeptidase MepM/ murein hydrolase activator NlpD
MPNSRAFIALVVVLTACSQTAPGADHTAVDTLVGIAPDAAEVKALESVVPKQVGIRPSSGAPVVTAADTGAVTATADELTALGRSMIIPVQGITVSGIHDTYTEARAGHTHEALDILAPKGTPVLSSMDGRVMKLHSSVAGGLMVYTADPSDRYILMYGHLDRYADGLAAGMPVKQGQVIGYVGTTGNAPIATPHLHFALALGHASVAWWKGTPINPFPLLSAPR